MLSDQPTVKTLAYMHQKSQDGFRGAYFIAKSSREFKTSEYMGVSTTKIRAENFGSMWDKKCKNESNSLTL